MRENHDIEILCYFFDLSVCPPCADRGKVCDPVSGECVCPTNTEGEYCERCAINSWGHDPLTGCKVHIKVQ